MARPTRVMAKQVTATSAISGPTAAISARGSADAVVVMARAFWAFTAGAANWAFTDLFCRTSEERNEERERNVSRFEPGRKKRENARLPSGMAASLLLPEAIRVALNCGGPRGGVRTHGRRGSCRRGRPRGWSCVARGDGVGRSAERGA